MPVRKVNIDNSVGVTIDAEWLEKMYHNSDMVRRLALQWRVEPSQLIDTAAGLEAETVKLRSDCARLTKQLEARGSQ